MIGNNENPLITIGIPLYNMVDSVCACVESCLRQTYTNIEILIVDDGSTDGAVELVTNKFRDDRITIYRRDKNGGVCLAMRDIVEHSRGEYICFMDADDLMMPNRVEKQIEAIKDKERLVGKGMVACFCGSVVNDVNRGKKYKIDPNNLFLNTRFSFGGGTGHSMYRRSDLLDLGNFDVRFSRSSDTAMCLKFLMSGGRYVMLQEPLIVYNFDFDRNKENVARKEWPLFKQIATDIEFVGVSNIYLRRFVNSRLADISIEDDEWIRRSDNWSLKLFTRIPLLNIKRRRGRTKCILFGFIPLFSIDRNK